MPQHYLRRTYAAKVKAVDAPKRRMHADELVAPHLGASFYASDASHWATRAATAPDNLFAVPSVAVTMTRHCTQGQTYRAASNACCKPRQEAPECALHQRSRIQMHSRTPMQTSTRWNLRMRGLRSCSPPPFRLHTRRPSSPALGRGALAPDRPQSQLDRRSPPCTGDWQSRQSRTHANSRRFRLFGPTA